MRITRQLIKQNTPVTVTYGDRWVLRRKVTVSITRRCSGGRSLLIHIVQRILSVVPWGNIIFMQLIVNYTEFVCKTILVRRRRPCPLNLYASASKNTKVPLHRVLAVRTYVMCGIIIVIRIPFLEWVFQQRMGCEWIADFIMYVLGSHKSQ